MRLALFTDSNIFYTDGAGRIIQELITYTKNHPDYSLTVFHRSSGPEKTEPYCANVTVHSISVPHVPLPGYNAYPLLYLSSPRKRLLRLTKEFQPDIVLTITPYLFLGIGRSAVYVAEKLKVPLVGSFDVHVMKIGEHYGVQVFRYPWVSWLALQGFSLMMKSYQKCTRILIPSKFVWGYAAEQYGAAKCVMFPRAVDSVIFSPTHRDESFKVQYDIVGKTTVLFVGRLSIEKNLGTLVDIYAQLKAKNNNIALVLVGEGPETVPIKARQLPDLVLTDPLRGKKLSRAYASADLFAFPSVIDAGPMVILEAMASGLPVVVSNQCGSQDEVIHGETGFVTRDPAEFAACVNTLIQNEQLRSVMGAKARAYAEGQNWERILSQLMAVFYEIKRDWDGKGGY
jgi:glycosyltransferase involved in cell wall biosynthesis